MPKALWFKLAFILILLLGLVIRLMPTQNNNFYFTMDQGDEAVRARELWFRHQIPLTGQGTSLPGIYHGPFWIWYISIGYFLFGGHPFGALFILMVLKLAILAYLMLRLAKHSSQLVALSIGVSLILFWPFYDASRYAFSPFPLVSIAILTLILLVESLDKKPLRFILTAAPVGMIFHTELASFPPFLALCLLTGIWGIINKIWQLKHLFLFTLVLSIFFIPHLITEIKSGFPQTKALHRYTLSSDSVFTTNAPLITGVFVNLIEQSVTPVKPLRVFGLFLAPALILYSRLSSQYIFSKRYITLQTLLLALSWIWFTTNSGWNPWHTVYIPPILFIAILLAIWNLPGKLGALVFLIIITAQIISFNKLYKTFFKPSPDPSLLTNELAAVDWVYQESAGRGFYVYSYLPSVYDYPYQYLFWWRGIKKYGYLPCEYSTAPSVPDLFIEGLKYYQNPQKPCSNFRFLIIEPDTRADLQNIWLEQVRVGTILIEETNFGKIRVEKRQL